MSLTYAFKKGQNVTYNSEIYTIFRHRGTVTPQYFIRKLTDGVVLDNVNESDLTVATCMQVVNAMWPSFTYNGDNGTASNWIKNNLLGNMYNCNMRSTWGANEDNTVYTYTMGTNSWTKNRT